MYKELIQVTTDIICKINNIQSHSNILDGNGFKPRTVVRKPATKMLTVSLPLTPYESKRKFLVLINGAELIFLQAVMDGDRATENFYCEP